MSTKAEAMPRPRPAYAWASGTASAGVRVAENEASRSFMAMLYVVAYALLATIYVLYTSSTWAYLGLYLAPSYGKIAASLAVLLIFVTVTPVKWSARTFFLNILLTVYLLPALILYGFSNRPTLSAAIVWMAVAIAYFISGARLPRMRLLSLGAKDIAIVLLLVSVVLLGSFYALGGFTYFNLDFSRVYEFRDLASESLPGIFGYFSLLFTTAVIPFGIALSLYHKNYIIVAIFTLISITLFGLTSHKAMALMPFLSIGVFVLLSRVPRYVPMLISFSALLFLMVAIVLIDSNQNPSTIWGEVENMFVRRALFIPTLVDYNYIDFFTAQPKYYWSTSRLTLGLLDAPYNGVAPPLLVGQAYFGEDNSANAGFIGSGFAHAGILGVVLYSIGVGLVISLFQAFSRHIGVPLTITATIGLFTSMIQSTDFVTLFLTHGLLPALVILMSLRDQAPVTGARPGNAPAAGDTQTPRAAKP